MGHYSRSLSRGYQRYSLVLLTATFSLSIMDREIVGILLESIRQDLNLSDSQLGFLTGFAFAIFYATLGIPIARLADYGNRKHIASCAIALWSVMVFATAFVGNFAQLAMARIATAVGESGVYSPTYSLLGDYFSPAERPRALSVFMSSISLAVVISVVFAGWVNQYYGWRMAFLVISIPGAILAIIIHISLKEPRDFDKTTAPNKTANTVSKNTQPLLESLKMLWQQPAYRGIAIALATVNIAGIGLNLWYPSFFIRKFAIETGELSLWFGLGAGGVGALSIWFGGRIMHRLTAGNYQRQMQICALATVLVCPCVLLLVTLPSLYWALAMLLPIYALTLFYYGPVAALLMHLVDDQHRALASSLVGFLVNFVGMGLGPQLVGWLSDGFKSSVGEESLAIAMALVSTITLVAAYLFWQASQLFAGGCQADNSKTKLISYFCRRKSDV